MNDHDNPVALVTGASRGGDMIDGTITPKLLERMHHGAIRARREQAGSLPTIDEFAKAIADAATDPGHNRSTVFVGSTS